MVLWRNNTTANNKTYIGLNVQCPITLSDFKHIYESLERLKKSTYQISRKTAQWELKNADRRMDVKLTGNFHYYSNAPETTH